MKPAVPLTLVLALLATGLAGAAAAPAGGRVVLSDLDARAEIRIDRWGVPHIYAKTEHDAFLLQGWNAARDRLWQIDLWRRSGLGELGAALGPGFTAQDRAIRLFVYRGDMTAEWAAYGSSARKRAEAFVAGINAFVAAAKADPRKLPAEFKLAGYEPAFWKPEDVVRIRNHGLVVGIGLQLMRAQAACQAGLDAADLLLPVTPAWKPIVPEGLDLCSIPGRVLDEYNLAQKRVSFGAAATVADATTPTPLALANTIERMQGSNNWVVGPQKTSTGRPILANDPHRADEVPSLRYLVHLSAPGLNVIGAGEPSLPGISIGHNERIAFGLTVFPIAQEDLYVYETNPENANEYRYRDGWEAMRVVHEKLAVRDAPDADIELKFTRHGPVVLEDPEHHRAYAVRATWLGTGGAPYFASMRYIKAQNLGEFADALKYWGEPGENQIFADTSGQIGWFPSGFVPIRPTSDGLLPLPGDGRYEWAGIMDRTLLPSEVDPARHYVATANQLNLPKDYPYRERRVGFSWYQGDRFDRITEVLESLPKVSIRDSEALQNDYLTIPGRRLVAMLKDVHTDDPTLRDAMAWLGEWNGQATVESPQAALFEVWISHYLAQGTFARAVPAIATNLRAYSSGAEPVVLELMEHPDARLGADPVAARDAIVTETLAKALAETSSRLGPDRTKWQWGQLASVLLEHPLAVLTDEPSHRVMNVGPAPKAGDGSTVGAAYYNAKNFRLSSGASFRMVLDVGNWDESVAVNTPGESGDWTSPHYRDLFPLWLDGRYFPLAFSRTAVVKATERIIQLAPK